MKIVYFFSLILITFSCNSQDSILYEIDPRNFVENKIILSEIADDITYIPLDNNIPFTYFNHVITPTSCYIAAKGIGILEFDREGNLIKKNR